MAYYIIGLVIVHDQPKTGGGEVMQLLHDLVINAIVVYNIVQLLANNASCKNYSKPDKPVKLCKTVEKRNLNFIVVDTA